MLHGYHTIFFIDKSKIVFGIIAWVFSDAHNVAVFSRRNEHDPNSKRNIGVLAGSQAVFTALRSLTTFFTLVRQGRDALNGLGGTFEVNLF